MDGKEEQAPSRPNTRGRASGRAQSLERHFAQRDLLEQQSAALPAGELRQLRETIAREDRQPRHAASVTARRADATMGDLGRELLAHGIPASASAMRMPPAAPTAPAAVAATAAEPAELRSSARRRRAQPPVPAPVFVTPARDVRFTLPVSETTDPSRGRLPAGADHGSMDDLFANAGYITPGGVPAMPPLSMADSDRNDVSDRDDGDSDHETDERPRRSARRISDPLAPTILQMTAATGARQWVRSRQWRNTRNQHEATQLALVIDTWRSDIRPAVDALPLEIVCRRLTGVVDADNTGTWDRAAAMELYRDDTLLTPEQLTFFSGVAKKNKKATDTGGRSSTSWSGSGRRDRSARGGDHQERGGRSGGRRRGGAVRGAGAAGTSNV